MTKKRCEKASIHFVGIIIFLLHRARTIERLLIVTPPEISVPPRAPPPSFEHIHPPPSLSFERLAFRMDLEDLKRTMRMQKQESFRPYPQPHTSREILSTGTNLERHSHYWTYQRNQISAPYSTAKASKKARRLSKRSQRGIGGDSSSGSDHPGERSISLPAVYD